MIAVVPRKPANEHIEVLYGNSEHFLHQNVAEFLAINQDWYALHLAKGYAGYIFAVTDPEAGHIRWYEEVWSGLEHRITYSAWDLQKLIDHVVHEWGYA